MSEPNVELIYQHTGEHHLPECPFVIEYGQVSPIVCTCPHIIGQFDSHDKLHATIDSLTESLSERDERIRELEGLLLNMGSYIGSDVFIAASNASDSAVKCEQLTTELAAAEAERDRYREALEWIAEGRSSVPQSVATAALTQEDK